MKTKVHDFDENQLPENCFGTCEKNSRNLPRACCKTRKVAAILPESINILVDDFSKTDGSIPRVL